MGKEEKVKEVETISEEKIIEVKKDKKDKKKNKKPINLILLFFLMLLAFLGEELLSGFIPALILKASKFGKYGSDFIYEIGAALIILVIILVSGKGYIFTEKRESFKKSVLIGWPFLLLSGVILFSNTLSLKSFDFYTFISLVVLLVFVGIYEELLCRGWLLNTFVRKHNKNYGQVVLSIVLSSLVFGMMHIVNALAGQSLFETLLQILQATAMGFFFGSLYYRTKNIYSVMFLHGFLDFAIMVGEMNQLRDCTYGTVTREIFIYEAINSLVISLMYICWGLCVLRRDKVDHLLDEPKGIKKQDKLAKTAEAFGIILFFAMLYIPRPKAMDEYTICYDYETIKIGISELHYSQKEEYELQDNGFDFVIKMDDDDTLWMINKNTKDKIELIKDVDTFEVVKQINGYMIIAIDKDANNNHRVNYSSLIIPSMFSDDKEFLNNVKESFNLYVIPDSVRLGYLTNDGTDYVYPLIDAEQENKFVIDEEGKLKVVEFTNEKVEKKVEPITEPVIEPKPDELLTNKAEDPLATSEEIVSAGITDEQIQEIIDQSNSGAAIE